MMKKHFLLLCSGICLFTSTAEASLLRMQWRGLPPDQAEISMAPGDTAIIDIYFEMNFAEETLTSLAYENRLTTRISQIATEVGPPGWIDSSVNGVLGDGTQRVEWTAQPGAHLTGPGGSLIGSQSIRLDDMGADAPIEIAFGFSSLELLGDPSGSYTFGPAVAGALPGVYAIGLGFWPPSSPIPYWPNPLIVNPIPEPASMVLVILGSTLMLLRRK